jgi:isocitrate dehydrogenase (NAD+)
MTARRSRKVRIAVIPGDGIGPEVIHATLLVLDAVQDAVPGVQLEYVLTEAGLTCVQKYGTSLPEATQQVLREADCCLKGPVTTPEAPGSPKSAVVQIRAMFDLYANVRPIKTLPRVPALHPHIDMLIVRENTEDLYAGIEFMTGDDAAVAVRLITRRGCERIARFAFHRAMERRRQLTYVHKGNILKITEGLFKAAVTRAAQDFPAVRLDEVRVDAMAMWLIRQPEAYDVIVTTNLFGDILSDEAAQTVGGLGVAPGANIGDDYAMFEPVHGSAPSYAGKDQVNPLAAILSSKLMLDWLGFTDAGALVERAVEAVLREGQVLTFDLAPKGVTPAKCSDVGQRIARQIRDAG